MKRRNGAIPDLPGAVALLMERLEDPAFREAYEDEFGVSFEVTKQGIRATLIAVVK